MLNYEYEYELRLQAMCFLKEAVAQQINPYMFLESQIIAYFKFRVDTSHVRSYFTLMIVQGDQ